MSTDRYGAFHIGYSSCNKMFANCLMSSIGWTWFRRRTLAERRFINGRSRKKRERDVIEFSSSGWLRWPKWMRLKISQRIKLGNFNWILKYVTMISLDFSRQTDGWETGSIFRSIFFSFSLVFILTVLWEAFFFLDVPILGDTEWNVIVSAKRNTCLYLIRLFNYKHSLQMSTALTRSALPFSNASAEGEDDKMYHCLGKTHFLLRETYCEWLIPQFPAFL